MKIIRWVLLALLFGALGHSVFGAERTVRVAEANATVSIEVPDGYRDVTERALSRGHFSGMGNAMDVHRVYMNQVGASITVGYVRNINPDHLSLEALGEMTASEMALLLAEQLLRISWRVDDNSRLILDIWAGQDGGILTYSQCWYFCGANCVAICFMLPEEASLSELDAFWNGVTCWIDR